MDVSQEHNPPMGDGTSESKKPKQRKEQGREMLERYIHFTNKVLKAMANERRRKSETEKMEKAS